ncbi:MAG: hypothetical protein QXQ68_08895, partial [Candidatus Nitrosocaldaceae archaeon]
MEQLLLWIGEHKNPIKKERHDDYVMDSIINYYTDLNPRLAYTPRMLFLDNGAFTASTHNRELDRERVLALQEKLNPDKTIPLDYPFGRHNASLKKMIESWEKTKENILYWQSSSSLKGRLVPALHAWNKESLRDNIRWLQSKADAEYIAIGSIVNNNADKFVNARNFFGDRSPNRDLLDMIHLAVKYIQEFSDFKIHMMGLGSSPLTLHLAYYLGISSTDSSGYRRKAAHGKIILQGTGERYVGNMLEATFGRKKRSDLSREDIMKLAGCRCDSCLRLIDSLWLDFKARAIHNEYTIKMEAELAREYMKSGLDKYERYLDS